MLSTSAGSFNASYPQARRSCAAGLSDNASKAWILCGFFILMPCRARIPTGEAGAAACAAPPAH